MFGGIAMFQVVNPMPFSIGGLLMLFIIIGPYLYHRWKGNTGMELAEKSFKTFVLLFILLYGPLLLIILLSGIQL
jgi:hypothetical protein